MNKEYKTLHAKLAEVAAIEPQHEVMQIKLKDGKYSTVTYAELLKTAQQLGMNLILQGIQKGDRIAIVLENRPEWIIIYFAIMFAGAIAIPIDPQSAVKDLAYYLQDSESKIVFTSQQYLSSLVDLNANLTSVQQIIVLDLADNHSSSLVKINSYQDLLSAKAVVDFPIVIADDLASILYTSGTTAKPKGVMLSHKNFYANYLAESQIQIIAPNNVLLAVLPLHHSFPFLASVILPLFKQCKVVFAPSLKSDELLQCMRETEVTIFPGVPQMFYLFAKHINETIKKQKFYVRWLLNSILEALWLFRRVTRINLTKKIFTKIHAPFGDKFQFFVSGGAKLNPEVELDLNKFGFMVLQGYGLTETAPGVSFNLLNHEKLGSAGKVIPGVEVKIDAPDIRGVGEITIRGPNVMRGYYKNPEATNAVLKNGWFYSGDLGYFDTHWNLFIVGRKKEIIVLSSGKNISPEEVEGHYSACKFIKELCVFELEANGEEKLVAVVHPDFAYFRQRNEVNIHHTIRWELESLSKHYPAYKHIMGFVITKEDLPRTRLGKLKRYEIKAQYLPLLQGNIGEREIEPPSYSDEELALVSTELAQKTFETLKQELNITFEPRLSDHLELDLGLDSLRRIELFGILEKMFNLNFAPADMAQIFTVKELIVVLSQAQQADRAGNQNETFSWQKVLLNLPPEEITSQIALRPSKTAKFNYNLLCVVLGGLTKLFWRLKIYGAENIPHNKSLVFCVNHASFLDSFIFAGGMPKWLRQELFFIGHRRFFDSSFMRKIVNFIHVIPVDSAANLVAALQASAFLLRQNKSVVIFPEGERSINGNLIPFRKGVGILAQELNVELLPVYIHGSHAAWPRGVTLPRFKPVQIHFGKPCGIVELKKEGYALGAKDDYEAIAKGIREAVRRIQLNVRS